jgi:hypothetical protein
MPPPTLHDQWQDKQIAEIQKGQTRQDRRYRATQVLDQFLMSVMARAESWETAARNIGSAYKLAADQHKAALTAQAQSDAIGITIMFSVLTVATAGAFFLDQWWACSFD